MEGKLTEAPTIGIGRLLKEGGRFFIPHHQRDYSWTEDQLEQLFDDITDAEGSGQTEYFIGLMVFMNQEEDERTSTILDGQQRLASTIIILSAIRTWLRTQGYSTDADQIQQEYIASREFGEQDWEPNLVLNASNNDTFERRVVRESAVEDVKRELQGLNRYDPNRRLLEAVLYYRTCVEGVGNSSHNIEAGAARLFRLLRYIRDSVKVVRLSVPNEANAYTVFETLNDRGLDLSVLDLIKNHLFGKAGNQASLRHMQGQWAQMTGNLTDVRADDFIKAWWISRYGRIQNPHLFGRFRSRVPSRAEARAASEDMLATSEKYAALGVPDDPMWRQYSSETRGHVANLRLIGGQQVHPVMLSALDKFPDREVERLMRLLEVLIVRYQLVGGGRTGRLEISCARLASRIYDGDCNTATEAFGLLKDIFPTDDQFRESFRTKEETNSQKARYLLSSLEIQARRRDMEAVSAAELEPSGSLTLEHVFPKSPANNWQDLQEDDPEFAEECTHRLGNLCLLTGVNRALGNKGFDEKKETYSRSNLLLTSEIAENSEWDRATVEARQQRMAGLAVAFWRFN